MNSFEEFWPYYVREHKVPSNRALHFVGSCLVLLVAAVMLLLQQWMLLVLLPIIGYGFAWTGHFLIERNRPATFKYPLWSLMGDWKMWGLMLVGRMGPEVDRILATR